MIRLFRFLPTRWWSIRAWKTWTSYIHWRLETFGLYGQEASNRATARRSLRRQFPSYYRWLGEVDRIRRHKSPGRIR